MSRLREMSTNSAVRIALVLGLSSRWTSTVGRSAAFSDVEESMVFSNSDSWFALEEGFVVVSVSEAA